MLVFAARQSVLKGSFSVFESTYRVAVTEHSGGGVGGGLVTYTFQYNAYLKLQCCIAAHVSLIY